MTILSPPPSTNLMFVTRIARSCIWEAIPLVFRPFNFKLPWYVSCFGLNNLVLLILSKVRSQSTFTNGWWAVTTNKLSQPSVKYLFCSRAYEITSPSAGTYLDSRSLVKRDSAKVILHPNLQHPGEFEGHSQCFCERKYPIPYFEKSGLKQVLLSRSNISTPFNSLYDSFYWLFENMIKFLWPFKFGFKTKEMSKRLHHIYELAIVSDLMY